MPDSLLVPFILSGGSDTRLWPVSREKRPKQLQPLPADESLLQNTLRRQEGLLLVAPIIVSNQESRFMTAEQLRQVGHPGGSSRAQRRGIPGGRAARFGRGRAWHGRDFGIVPDRPETGRMSAPETRRGRRSIAMPTAMR